MKSSSLFGNICRIVTNSPSFNNFLRKAFIGNVCLFVFINLAIILEVNVYKSFILNFSGDVQPANLH